MSRGLDARSHSVHEHLEAYAAVVNDALRAALPEREPYDYLYRLLPEYPARGGKRLRPALCIAAAGAFGGDRADAMPTAVAFELLHTAFMVHDDIEDQSTLRRGRPTIHEQVGVPLAINVGDALFALSLEQLEQNFAVLETDLALWVMREFRETTMETIEGQALELGWQDDAVTRVSASDYVTMVYKKTSWYTSVQPCRIGAEIGSARSRVPVDHEAITLWGLLVGGLFQVVDDLLNVSGVDPAYGKTTCDDLIEGKRTLLVTHLLQHDVPDVSSRMSDFLRLPRRARNGEQVAEIVDLMRTAGSFDYVQSCARCLAKECDAAFERAFGSLHWTPDVDLLAALPSHLLERTA
ncbi:MAG: polyprenyl synthetase family protein [Actinomycetota bacterium]